MNYNELSRQVKEKGCIFVREGANHEIWMNPETGRKFQIPRHGKKEVPKGTLERIRKDAGLK